MNSYRPEFIQEVIFHLIETRSIAKTREKYDWVAINSIKKWKNEYEKKNNVKITLSREKKPLKLIHVPKSEIETAIIELGVPQQLDYSKLALLQRIVELAKVEKSLELVTRCYEILAGIESGENTAKPGGMAQNLIQTIINNSSNGQKNSNPSGDK